jgi:hypothetical protein
MIGVKFGRLLVLSEHDIQNRKRRYVCQCDCGEQRVVLGRSLRQGHTRSCGCVQRERASAANMTHANTAGGRWSPEYTCWHSIIQRCTNPNVHNFEKYGGRGISVCERWLKFENFLSDMGPRPPKRSVDRINNDGNYEPGNCRWATRVVQMHNQGMRKNNTSGYKGVRWHERLRKWVAQITINGERRHLGCFCEKEEAIAAYAAACTTSQEAGGASGHA